MTTMSKSFHSRSINIDLVDNKFRIVPYSGSSEIKNFRSHRPIVILPEDCSLDELGNAITATLAQSSLFGENPDYFESTKEFVKALKVKSLKYLYDNGKFVSIQEYEKEKEIILMPGEKSSIRGIQYIPERKEVYPSNVDSLVLAKRVKELCDLL